MSLRGRELLTAEQRLEFVRIPEEISEQELGRYFTLSDFDIEIIKKRRRDYNRLGFAIQLCVLRHPGWSLNEVEPIPEVVLNHVAKQLDVDHQSFSLYSSREATKYEHLEEIRNIYGFKNFSFYEYRKASRYLLQHAMKNGNTMYLLNTIIDELRNQRIFLPGMTTLEKIISLMKHYGVEFKKD